jgi:glycosyltransferase involved in cell wall biosynthesis
LWNLKNKKNYTIVYTQYNLWSIVLGYIAKKYLGYIWVFDLWDHPTLEFHDQSRLYNRIKKYLYYNYIQHALTTADAWVISMQRGIMQHLPPPPVGDRVFYITNGSLPLSTDIDPVSDKSEPVLKICYAGFVIMERGISIVLDALKQMPENISVELSAMGISNNKTINAINRHNANHLKKFRYIGEYNHKDTIRRISMCDIGICILEKNVLNYEYAYPIKVFEYMTLGKIVIATRTEAMSEIIQDGVNGFLIDNTPESLINVLQHIKELHEADKLDNIRQSAMETSEQYRWGIINKNLITWLNTLLDC